MAEFCVNTNLIKTHGQELMTCGKNMRRMAGDVDTVKANVNIGSHSTTMSVVKRLIVIETDVMEEAVKAENMARALAYIAKEYLRAENAVNSFNGGIGELLQNMIKSYTSQMVDAVLSLLGLDDAYYRRKMGYKSYDAAKKQEYLMDHYLSEACQNMLKQPKYSEAAWKKASSDERKKMLEDFILEINEYMGTDVDTKVNFEDLGTNGARGYYDPDTNSVTINSRYLTMKSADSYIIMRTMIHEMRHCYQHTAADHPEQFLVSEQTLEKWRENFPADQYKTVKKDGYEAYVQQPIEWDAKNFAGQKADTQGYTPEYRGSW